MGQQQLLLIVLGTIIVGVAVVVGINMFTQGAVNAESDAIVQDIANIGAKAAANFRKPLALGGFGRTFATMSTAVLVSGLGIADTSANAVYVISAPGAASFVVTGTGLNEGVVVVSTVTQAGAGVPAITLP